jgi:transposase
MSNHPSQKRYPPELKERAIRMVLEIIKEQNGERHGVAKRVASQLGIGVETLRRWVNQAEIDGGLRPGLSTPESEQLKALAKENRELKRANEILIAAATFFGAALDRQQKR